MSEADLLRTDQRCKSDREGAKYAKEGAKETAVRQSVRPLPGVVNQSVCQVLLRVCLRALRVFAVGWDFSQLPDRYTLREGAASRFAVSRGTPKVPRETAKRLAAPFTNG